MMKKEDERDIRNDKKRDTYKILFGSEKGKIVLEDLKDFVKLNQSGFNSSSDSTTAFNLGRKEVVLYIKNIIEKE